MTKPFPGLIPLLLCFEANTVWQISYRSNRSETPDDIRKPANGPGNWKPEEAAHSATQTSYAAYIPKYKCGRNILRSPAGKNSKSRFVVKSTCKRSIGQRPGKDLSFSSASLHKGLRIIRPTV